MKKATLFSLTLALGLFGITSIWAQDSGKRYVEGDLVSDPSGLVGQDVVLKSVDTGNSYLDASLTGRNTGSSTITDDCLFQFVEAGDVDGEPTYYLKNVKTGKWLRTPLTPNDETGDYTAAEFSEYGDGPVSYTDDQALAYRFWAGLGQSDVASDKFYSTMQVRKGDTPLDPFFVFPNVQKADPDGNGGTWQWLSGYNAYFMFARYFDTNGWYVLTVMEQTGVGHLQTVLNELFPTGEAPAALFTPGSVPGNVDATALDNLQKAYEKAMSMISTGAGTNEEFEAATTELQSAYDAVIASTVPMKAGYYYVESLNYSGNLMTATSAGWSWSAPSNPEDSINYIIQIEPGSTDSTFHIVAASTAFYAGAINGNSNQVKAVSQGEAAEYLILPSSSNSGYFYMTTNNGISQGLHAQADGKVVGWNYTTPSSQWKFVKVADDKLAALQDQLNKARLNAQLSDLYSRALASYNNSRHYDSGMTDDNDYDGHGLLKNADQLFSSPLDQTDNAPLSVLLDGQLVSTANEKQFIHTTWHTTDAPNYNHYVGADLGEAVSAISFKYSRRIMGNAWKTDYLAYPTQFRIYVSNDDNADTRTWKEVGTYDASFIVPDSTLAVSGVDFGDAYRYVRLDVTGTKSGKTVKNDTIEGAKAYPFFYMSELGIWSATYDAANSPYSQVPEADAKAFEAALSAAAPEVAAQDATQATLDQLQSAYDKFLESYADPQLARDAIASAQTVADSAAVGTDPGYVSQETFDALTKAISTESAKVSNSMPKALVNEVIDNMKKAVDTFTQGVILPSTGTYYFITSKGKARPGIAVGAADNANGARMVIGGMSEGQTELDMEFMNTHLNYAWVVEKQGDEYYLRNMGTGFYMKSNTTVDKPQPITFEYAKAGTFYIVTDTTKTSTPYLNNNQSGVFAYSKDDNCLYAFQKTDLGGDEAYTYINVTPGYRFMCLPYATNGISDGTFYSIVGRNGNKLVLAETSETEPGEPLVYYLENATETGQTDVGVTLSAGVTNEGLTKNGVTGVLGGTTVGAGFGVLGTDGIIKATTAEVNNIGANSGYMGPDVPETTETGDLQLTIDGEITGIGQVVVIPADGNYYDLSGRRVARPTKGVYIHNGKKVIIK